MDTVDAPRLPPAQPLAKFQYCALATLAKASERCGGSGRDRVERRISGAWGFPFALASRGADHH
jgi:hypothetical protein